MPRTPFHIPPAGWYTFGTHADEPDMALEFSEETDSVGDPWFERPVATPDFPDVEHPFD